MNIPATIEPKIIVMVMKYLSLKRCQRLFSIITPHQKKCTNTAGAINPISLLCLRRNLLWEGTSLILIVSSFKAWELVNFWPVNVLVYINARFRQYFKFWFSSINNQTFIGHQYQIIIFNKYIPSQKYFLHQALHPLAQHFWILFKDKSKHNTFTYMFWILINK